jgi:hypothetical protein
VTLQSLLIALASLLGLLVLFRKWRVGHAERMAQRGRLLAHAPELLTVETETQLASHYRKIAGRYQGHILILHPILDSLHMRKLPVLWLSLTLVEKLPLRGTLNLMMRPSGLEIFSGFHDLPISIATPPDFPAQAQLRCDGLEGMPPASLIEKHLKPYFDGTAKELLITPNGIRMVWLLAEAERANYLLFRDAEFTIDSLPREQISHMLEALMALRQDILRWNEEPK